MSLPAIGIEGHLHVANSLVILIYFFSVTSSRESLQALE